MTTNYYFGFLEFPPQSDLDQFEEEAPGDEVELRQRYLFDYVNRPNVVYAENEDEGLWRFGDCEIIEGDIYGKFGRNFLDATTRWDKEEEDYKIEEEEIQVANVSHFIIFPEIPAIAFNRKNRIGPTQFRDAFVGGYNRTYSGAPIAIQLLRTGGEFSYRELIEYAEEIHRLEFDLVPTNPFPDDEMELLDDHLRDMGTDDFSMEAKVEDEDDSLDPQEDLLKSAGALADGDYGSFEATFTDPSGNTQPYNSKGEFETEEIPEPEEIDEMEPHAGSLLSSITDVLSRREVDSDDEISEDSDSSRESTNRSLAEYEDSDV